MSTAKSMKTSKDEDKRSSSNERKLYPITGEILDKGEEAFWKETNSLQEAEKKKKELEKTVDGLKELYKDNPRMLKMIRVWQKRGYSAEDMVEEIAELF